MLAIFQVKAVPGVPSVCSLCFFLPRFGSMNREITCDIPLVQVAAARKRNYISLREARRSREAGMITTYHY